MDKYKYLTSINRRNLLIDDPNSRRLLNNLFAIVDYDNKWTSKIPKIYQINEFVDIRDLSNYTLVKNNTFYLNHYELVLLDDKYRCGIWQSEDKFGLIVLSIVDKPAYSIYEIFDLTSEDIDNYIGQGESTTVGLWLTNHYIVSYPSGGIIPYINKEFSPSKLESIFSVYLRDNKLDVSAGYKYLNNTYFLSEVMSKLVVPVFTEKSLVPSDAIIKRKQELFDLHKDELDNPVVVTSIEQELIGMDKEYLKHDDSMGFFGDASKKFNVHRKKQYIMGGLVEVFDKVKGKYNFIPESLTDGWSVESFPSLANEGRRGSFSRGVDTQDGGLLTKEMLRLFQNAIIDVDDCKTKRGLSILLTSDNYHEFIDRNITIGDTTLILTDKLIKSYIGKIVKLRSPMFCEAKNYCFTCCGEKFRTMDIKSIGLIPLELGAAFLTLSMKAMHGTSNNIIEITDINKFII